MRLLHCVENLDVRVPHLERPNVVEVSFDGVNVGRRLLEVSELGGSLRVAGQGEDHVVLVLALQAGYSYSC